MALNIKNRDVERLAAEVAAMTGESKTESIRKALEQRRDRLSLRVVRVRKQEIADFLEREIWPLIPESIRGRGLSKEEQEKILGMGPAGV